MTSKWSLVYGTLFFRLALACDWQQLCTSSSCSCSGSKITCSDSRFVHQAFHCNFNEYRISSRTPVEIPWKSLSFKDVNNTSNFTVNLENVILNCSSCENAWILQWQAINATTLEGLKQCVNCPQLSVFTLLDLPPIVFANNYNSCDRKQLLEKCAIPDPKVDKPLRFIKSKDSEDKVIWKCTSVYEQQNTSFSGCLSAKFQPIPLPGIASKADDHKINATRYGDEPGECVTEYTLDFSNLNVTHSGFFGCSIKTGFIPAVEWRFVAFNGVPHFLEWNLAKGRRDVNIHAKIISATNFEVHLLYTPNDIITEPTDIELMYDIRPSDDDEIRRKTKFEMTNVEVPFTMDNNKSVVNGIRKREVTLEFRDIMSTCLTYGVYYLIANNEKGPSFKKFAITEVPFVSVGCKLPTEKFHVIMERNLSLTEAGNNITGAGSTIWSMFDKHINKDNPIDGLVLTTTIQPQEEQPITGVFVVIANIIIIIFGIGICFGIKKILDKRAKHNAEQVTSSHQMDLLNPLLVQNPSYFDWMQSVQTRTDITVIPSDDLEVVREIGQGAFGQVHLVRRMPSVNATVLSAESDHLLAMKQLKYVSSEKLVDLEHEASVLTKLSHPNIVKFYGITLINGAFGLLFEFMSEGDLVTYLRDHSQELKGTAPVPYFDMLRISIQVASGLEYLHSHHLVHRDVAARNCLVTDELIVKLSDFGMTRDVYVTDYYKMDSHTLVPLRWLPPESIVYRKFTVESDMWSYGVLLWEIFSGGQVPWYMYSNIEVLEIVKSGSLLTKPERCPDTVYDTLILQCWANKPSDRITATSMKEKLTELLDITSAYCSLTMDRSSSVQDYENLIAAVKSNSHRSA